LPRRSAGCSSAGSTRCTTGAPGSPSGTRRGSPGWTPSSPRPPAPATARLHLCPIRLRLERLSIDRARFIQELKERQVGTSVHFIPLHRQPFYAGKYGYTAAQFPVAESVYHRLVSLPIYSRMTDEDVDSVVSAVRDVAQQYSA
jgi:dTDP-4-amino-4,6-dideoxygalactose transaminase